MTQSVEQPDDAAVEEILRLVRTAKVRALARRRRRLRRRALVLLTAVVALSAVATLRIAFGGTDGHKREEPRTSSTGATASPTALRSIPDFAWVAAKGAVGYRIEFLREGRAVHTATTTEPRLHVAAATLPPGRYRWRVWALDTSGSRVGRAIVNASLNLK